MTLGEAKVGSTVVVTKIDGDGAYKRRIMDMGITKGTEIYVRKVAPLGDPVEVTAVSYTHLDVYKRQMLLRRTYTRYIEPLGADAEAEA